MLAKDGGQTTNLRPESGSDMLRAVRHEVLNAPHDIAQKGGPVHEGAESRDLTGNRCPYLGLVVLEQFYKGRNQIPRNNFLVHRFRDLSRLLANLQTHKKTKKDA